jgi:16S rRNA (cytosine967-C5)-methyltransferase
MKARDLALGRLKRIEKDGAYAGLVSGSVDDSTDAREERFATEITAGVTRWRRRLDFLVDQFYDASRGSRLDLVVRLILRVGIYELLHLSTPSHAAINEAVELAKRSGARRASGLINGILRNVDRKRAELPTPDSGDAVEDLAIAESHPTWMVRRWVERYGLETAAELCRWNNRAPRFGVRINTLRISKDDFLAALADADIEFEQSRFLDDFVVMESVQGLIRLGFIRDGLCAIQDEAAALVVRLLDPKPGNEVLDTCAAPGGKALLASTIMQDRGRVVAIDVNEKRTRLISRAAERMGSTIIEARSEDAAILPPEYNNRFDRVLVDAPCSGLGVLSKRADLRWRIDESDLAELAVLQSRLFDSAAKTVRPGGVIVYSTCTLEPEENVEQVTRFLSEHPEFGIEDASSFLPQEVVTSNGYYASLPHIHQMDGAFGVRLVRHESA